MSIKVTRTSLPSFEEYCRQIRPLWDSHILTNMGPQHNGFQSALQELTGCCVTLFSHGHLALEAAIRAFGLPAGSKIVTSPFTFVSTVHAISRLGFEPVFCDVLPQDGTLDPAALESLLDDRVSLILPVHVYGNVCDVEAIGELARSRGIPVLYDAAHAFGVDYKGVPVVRYGDASVLSFHATKVFSTVEGGAVCYRDASLEQVLADERNFGIRDEYTCASAGGNAKMNELQAAMGICNLRHFGEALKERERLWKEYRKRLYGTVGFCSLREGATQNYSYMPVFFESQQKRDAAADALDAAGIHARKYFFPLACDALCYRHLRADVEVARSLAGRVLTLPLYPGLKDEELELVCSVLTGL